jgi:formate dehydrogenase alpha subunit
LEQIIYHSGKMSTQDEGLMKIYNKPTLKIGASDAESLGLKTDDLAKIKTPEGEVEVLVEVTPSLPKGMVQFPEHFNRPAVKDLLACEISPITHVPSFKKGAVALEKGVRFKLAMIPTGANGENSTGPHIG